MSSRAWLLGAGFSKAIANCMPTLNELGLQICSTLGSQEDSLALVSESERSVLRAGQIPMGDLEVWLTTLTTPQPFLEEGELLRRRALAVELASLISESIESAQREARSTPMPNWLSVLVALWHHSQDVVLTLNYDTLVESALNELRLLPRLSHDPHPSLLADALRDYPQHAPAAFGLVEESFKRTLELLKLHGSVNWFRLRGSGQVVRVDALVPAWERKDPSLPHYFEASHRGASRALLLPQSDKSAGYSDAAIANLWRRARDLLNHVDELIMFGYSVPTTDTSVTALLSQCIRPDARVTIIDLEPAVVRARLNRLGIGSKGSDIRPGTVECDKAFAAWLGQPETLDAARISTLTAPYYIGAQDQLGTEWGAVDLTDSGCQLKVTLAAKPLQFPYSYISLIPADTEQMSRPVAVLSTAGKALHVMDFHTADGANVGTNIFLDVIDWNGQGPQTQVLEQQDHQGEINA